MKALLSIKALEQLQSDQSEHNQQENPENQNVNEFRDGTYDGAD